ncbi:MAG: acetate--CoA ligase family protein [Actinomycetales bacterium]
MTAPTAAGIRPLWDAASVAVIGATERLGAMGRLPIDYLQRFGYAGRIIPVNPKGGTILGIPAVTNIREVPGQVELACVMVPAAAVEEAVRDCAAAGVRTCIVMSSGFAEADEAGAQAQRRLVQIARGSGMRIVGPNCIGSVGGARHLMATFSPLFSAEATPLPSGRIALVSQSGALGYGALSLGMERGVPIGIAVTTGNEADVTALEVARVLAEEPDVQAVLLYVESLDDVTPLAQGARHSPIAVLKAGRSEAGARAAASHTGALASPDAVVDSALARAGIARVADLDALLDLGALLATGARLAGAGTPRIGVVTTSGGSGILAADAIADHGLQLADLDARTVADLTAIVPSYGNATNPVDVTAAVMAEPGLFERCVDRLADDPNVDAIVACFAVLVGDDVLRIANALGQVRARTGLPVVAARTGASWLAPQAGQLLADAGVAVMPTPERAVQALAGLAACTGPVLTARQHGGRAYAAAPYPGAQASEAQVKAALAAAGLPVPESMLLGPGDALLDEVADAVTSVGGRAVLKAVVPGLLHKSDVGGVLLDVQPAQARDAAAQLLQVAHHLGKADQAQVLVERFVPPGVEVLVGISPSPLGKVLTIGVGGVLTEVVADSAVTLLPVHAEVVEAMLDQTRVGRLLAGVRGRPAADRAALVELILGLTTAVSQWPDGYELDLNPVTVLPDGCWILDAMLHVEGLPLETER